jgi:hypothetical protein
MQVIGESKNSRVSDADNYALSVVQSDAALREFMSSRSDDLHMKQQMLKKINQDGYVKLSDMDSNPENKVALNTLDIYYLGSSIKTDLITPGLMLKDTQNNKAVKQSVSSKYDIE